MALSQDYHISTRSFLQHVQVACVAGALPIVLGAAFIFHLPAEPPFLTGWLMGLSGALLLLVAGGYQLCFEDNPGSAWGVRFHNAAPEIFPPILVMLRYAMYAISFVIVWNAAQALWREANPLGTAFGPWMNASFYAVLLLHPVNFLFRELIDPGRRKWVVILAALVRMLKLNANISFVLAVFSTTRLAEAIIKGEGLHVAVLLLVPCGLVSVTSVILFVDLILRWEVHERKLR